MGRVERRRRQGQTKAKPQWVTAKTRQNLIQEAKKLGLQPEEYLRLIVNVSGTLRRGLADGEQIDASKLVEWAENPLVLSMIQWVCQYALKTITSEKSEDTSKPPNTEIAPTPSDQTQQPPQSAQPAYIDPWYGPIDF